MNKLQNSEPPAKIPSSPPNKSNVLINKILQEFSEQNGTNTGHSLSPPDDNLYRVLSELCGRKKMSFFKPTPYIEYTPPKLTQGKIWYITYYVQDPKTMRLKRMRIKVNRGDTLRERKAMAKAIMGRLSEKLAMGWNPLVEKFAPKAYKKLFEAFDAFLDAKRRELEANSLRSYMSFIKTIREWLQVHGCDENTYACGFTGSMAIDFMESIESNPKISPRTYNNYLIFCRVLFDWMVEREYVSENPFTSIRRKPKKLTKKKRRILSDAELSRLWEYLESENQEYLVICMLCYCCLMRPKEISMLKCSDIRLDSQTVLVRGEIAKNDNTSSRTIPDVMMQYVHRLDLSNPKLFLFGNHSHFDFSPGKTAVPERKIATFWNRCVREECGFPMEVMFYSLKDTGITNMAAAGVPVSFIQQQADHSSLAMTSIYCQRSGKATEELKGVDILKVAE